MSYCRISAATITAPDFQSLLSAWREHGASLLVDAYRCETRLSKAEVRALPKGLRRKLQVADDSLAFLEGLWSLSDNRGNVADSTNDSAT